MSVLKSRNQSQVKELYQFTQGIEVDKRLASAEIRVQKAWIRQLVQKNILSKDESETALRLLDQALSQIEDGTFEWRERDEDVHMNLERFITDQAPGLGAKIHLGRSRNDLIATTLRLFVSDCLAEVSHDIKNLTKVLLDQSEKQIETLVPGLTHLQNGQVIRLSHFFNAYALFFLNDLKTIRNAQTECLAMMPLGSAALAGSHLDLDYEGLAQDLGFAETAWNSYAMVASRDFIVDALHAFSKTALHTSRLAEDLIYWSSTAVGVLRLPVNWSTGSSIMPNKRNPDVPELTRAKSSHVLSAMTNAHTLLKALPTAYMSDLHEIKAVFLRAFDELQKVFTALPPFVAELSVNEERAQSLLNQGHVLATEIANDLAKEAGFRQAYQKVAELVQQAEAKGQQVHHVAEGNYSFTRAAEARNQPGGTSKEQVQKTQNKIKNELNQII